MLENQDDMTVGIERIQSVFQQAPVTLLVTVVNAVLTAVVLSPVVSARLLAIWLILIILVSGGRWAARQCFLRRVRDGAGWRTWAALSISGSLTTGILWGMGAPVLFPAADTYQLFFALVVGGMCAGTTAVNSAHLPTVLAYILPASLPLAGSFLAEGSTPRLVSALMILVFAAALSLTSLRAHRAFGERLRLQLALSRQGGELSNANERLRGEIAGRQKAEETLHQAQKVEAIGNLVSIRTHIGCRNIDELNRRARMRLLPVIRELEGFRSIKLIKLDNETVAFVLMFSTLDLMEAANRTIQEMVRTECGRFAPNPPEVLLGHVLWEVRW